MPQLAFQRCSEVFRDLELKTVVNSSNNACAGTLHLVGVSKTVFRLLLQVLFPIFMETKSDRDPAGPCNNLTKNADSTLPTDLVSVLKLTRVWKMDCIEDTALRQINSIGGAEGWIAALKLSTTCNWPEIRAEAIKRLEKLSFYERPPSMDLIQLAKECRAPELLLHSYKSLVLRSEEISMEEISRLGWETTAKLLRLRDKQFRSRDRFDLNESLRHMFKEVRRI